MSSAPSGPFTCMPQPCQLSKLPPAFTFNIVPYYMDDFTHKPNALIVIHSHRDMHAPFIWIMCLNIPPTLADFFVIFWYKYKLVNKLSFFLFPAMSVTSKIRSHNPHCCKVVLKTLLSRIGYIMNFFFI